MPHLIQDIKAQKHQPVESFISYFLINATVQQGDYIRVKGLIALLQNYNDSTHLEVIQRPLKFGLYNDTQPITLKISY